MALRAISPTCMSRARRPFERTGIAGVQRRSSGPWLERAAGRPRGVFAGTAGRNRSVALARRGVDRAIVVAHSLAGVLGLAMALNAPGFVRGLVLLAPVSHPWVGGVLWYYTVAGVASHRAVVSLAGRRSRRPADLVGWSASGIRAGRLPDYIERTRLRLMLRPWHFKYNAEDVVDIEAHVAVLSQRYGMIRADRGRHGGSRPHRPPGHPRDGVRPRYSRRDAEGARGRRPFAPSRRAGERGRHHSAGGSARARLRRRRCTRRCLRRRERSALAGRRLPEGSEF